MLHSPRRNRGGKMRRTALVFLAFVSVTLAPGAQSQTPPSTAASPPESQTSETPVPKPAPVGTMSELMLKVIYPYSDAMFYIQRAAPNTDVEWNELQGKAL